MPHNVSEPLFLFRGNTTYVYTIQPTQKSKRASSRAKTIRTNSTTRLICGLRGYKAKAVMEKRKPTREANILGALSIVTGFKWKTLAI